ncbi:MAG TPA: hypothetical protein VMJ32_07015, partial [Pirellulales bacterium]|nr:hypothetical protein [Pirellulales bacterium]
MAQQTTTAIAGGIHAFAGKVLSGRKPRSGKISAGKNSKAGGISTAQSLPGWLIVAGIVFIALATLVVYWPSRNGEFLWDGGLLITKNPLVKAPDGLYRIWFTREAVDYWP